jgi:hypothetical protein
MTALDVFVFLLPIGRAVGFVRGFSSPPQNPILR